MPAPAGGTRQWRGKPSGWGRNSSLKPNRPKTEIGGNAVVDLLFHGMAPIMFAALVVFLLLGYPVAFSLAAVGLIFGLLGIELGLFRPDFLQALPERVFGVMSN